MWLELTLEECLLTSVFLRLSLWRSLESRDEDELTLGLRSRFAIIPLKNKSLNKVHLG